MNLSNTTYSLRARSSDGNKDSELRPGSWSDYKTSSPLIISMTNAETYRRGRTNYNVNELAR